jgi:hypothetical protein
MPGKMSGEIEGHCTMVKAFQVHTVTGIIPITISNMRIFFALGK